MVYPFYAILKTESGLSMQIQKVSLLLLQFQVYTTATAVLLSIKPFSFGLLTIYYLSPIVISWLTNYIFGPIALGFRKKDSIFIKFPLPP